MPVRPAEELLPLTHVVYHILLSMSGGDKHGYAIIKDLATRTNGRLELEAGTLYAAIKRMRDEELITEVAAPKGTDARRRCYSITPFGCEVLSRESRRLEAMVELAREAKII
jgi:DNA-binding PadR family transcriptional regulator